MKRLIMSMLGALFSAGIATASEAAPEEIKRQNQYVEYRMQQGEIYRIYVKMNDGVTTVQFPSAISEIAGRNVSTDGKGTDFIIQAQSGNYYFNIAATTPGATGTLTVTHNRKLYILYLIQSDKEAYSSVVFGDTGNRRNFSSNVVTATPKVTPARLISLIDICKKYYVLAETHPEAVAECEHKLFQTRYRCGKYNMTLLDATRFEQEDTVIFHVELENLTEKEIQYDKHSFSAHAGQTIYYMSVSDASGIIPPKAKTQAWFGITSTPRGGRNNLKADNDWLLAVTTKEMHKSQIQSVKKVESDSAKRFAAEQKEQESAKQTMSELMKMRAELAKEKWDLERREKELSRTKQQILDASGALKSAQAIQRMCDSTREAVSVMKAHSDNAVRQMKKAGK